MAHVPVALQTVKGYPRGPIDHLFAHRNLRLDHRDRVWLATRGLHLPEADEPDHPSLSYYRQHQHDGRDGVSLREHAGGGASPAARRGGVRDRRAFLLWCREQVRRGDARPPRPLPHSHHTDAQGAVYRLHRAEQPGSTLQQLQEREDPDYPLGSERQRAGENRTLGNPGNHRQRKYLRQYPPGGRASDNTRRRMEKRIPAMTGRAGIPGYSLTDWLPTTMKEVKLRGWDYLDVILFSGDAYVDHPSFGTAVIARLLENEGLQVAVVPQPNWRDDLRDFKKLSAPRLFFAVTAGVMDSMINRYTANKRIRSNDAYTPDGRSDMRPDRAVTVYSRILKELYPDVPILLGGVEASLRRVSHYDYWDNTLHPTILAETGADLLIYGMGELPLKQLIEEMRSGKKIPEIHDIPQTAFLCSKSRVPESRFAEEEQLYSHEECLKDKRKQAQNFRV